MKVLELPHMPDTPEVPNPYVFSSESASLPDEAISTGQTSLFERSDDSEHFIYSILNDPELRTEYLQLTDELIKKMVEQKTETAIFLDKSARPVAWLVHNFWDQLAPPPVDGQEPHKRPDIKFLNIDREQWQAFMGSSQDSMITADGILTERIDELRKVLAPTDGSRVTEDSDAPKESLLSGKKVMVIDEIKNSGDTLDMATKILKRGFKDAEIRGEYWMQDPLAVDKASGQEMNTKNPVWYKPSINTGRGIANRDLNQSQDSNSVRQRIGRFWLSTPYRKGADPDGQQLRKEIGQMAVDLKNHDLLYIPAAWSPKIDSLSARVERINGISTEDYLGMRYEASKQSGGMSLDQKMLQRLFRERIAELKTVNEKD